MPQRSFYTTFEISHICEVNPTTVQNWIKEKKLKAYVTPGGHRRVLREDLAAFMKEFGMPLPDDLKQAVPLVLIVDDEPDVLDLLSSILLDGGDKLEVLRAQSGVEALLMIGERKPDLLILDVRMPGMNGYEVCTRLKASPGTRNIRITAISADHDPSMRERILAAGADLFFTKPLEVSEFRSQCLSLLRS